MASKILLSEIYSFVFLAMASFYLLLGNYVFILNTKASMNRTFFALCTTLWIWSFSYCIANSASDYETALFWNRLSVLGWGLMYSVLLHYFLILTERTVF